ncbi:MAG TPA: DciA family protein [Jatrophihabitans sp.]|nr:DciA family protein [Jatrophihabitans sp.]
MSDDQQASSPHVVHHPGDTPAPSDGGSDHNQPKLSTEQADSGSTDLASEALRAARLIAAGRSGTQPSRRLRRAGRRGRSGEAGGYSGARPDGRDPMSLGAIVERTSKDLGWSAPLAEARVLGQWASVVGPEIAAHCQPTSLTDGELRIVAESTAWATQLRLMSRQILGRIGQELPRGTVTKLHISGPSGPSWKHGPWSMRGGRGVRDTYG